MKYEAGLGIWELSSTNVWQAYNRRPRHGYWVVMAVLQGSTSRRPLVSTLRLPSQDNGSEPRCPRTGTVDDVQDQPSLERPRCCKTHSLRRNLQTESLTITNTQDILPTIPLKTAEFSVPSSPLSATSPTLTLGRDSHNPLRSEFWLRH